MPARSVEGLIAKSKALVTDWKPDWGTSDRHNRIAMSVAEDILRYFGVA